MAVDLTSLHIARAVDGDATSRAFLVERFSPVLMAQAEYRLRGELRASVEPADLVHDVWLVTLPRLPDLQARDGRWTPVVLRFLATTLMRKVQGLLRARIAAPTDAATSGDLAALARDPGVVTQVLHGERAQAVRMAIDALPADQRELLVLRGVEQLSNGAIARKLGIPDYEATRRYQRALASLRAALPGSLFDELVEA